MLRLIIDTNIFISREDATAVSDNLQELLRITNAKAQLLVHPLSVEDINQGKDESRKNTIKSKLGAYNLLESPPKPEQDKKYIVMVGEARSRNDVVDNSLLYSLYKNAADFLITEDKGIHKKSRNVGLADRVLNIEDALSFFKKQYPDVRIHTVPALKQTPVHNINYDDPILDALKRDYGESAFRKWWEKISKEGRKVWVYPKGNAVGALLIYKIEDEAIESEPPLEKKKRLKICTLVVSHRGYKIGELFIKMSIEFAIKNGIYELYLTHFTEPNDRFVSLITDFGFYKAGIKGKEDVFLKMMIPKSGRKYKPLDISKMFYPSLYDGAEIRKFIVPILPQFHERLFTDYKRQSSLSEHTGEMIIEGNTIKKAYLCNSKIKKINNGDILLFYRSEDSKITSIGVAESVHEGLSDPEEIRRIVGKRTVYSDAELKEMSKKPTTVIIFRHHFHLKNPVNLNYMIEQNILKGAPQSIVEIDHNCYKAIRAEGGVDERFTVNKA